MALSHKVLIELVAKGDQAAAEFKKTAGAVDRLTGAQKTQASAASRVTGFMRDNAGALAAVATAGAVGLAVVKSSISAYTDWASQVRQVQRVSGTTAQAASQLTYAFQKVGLGAEGGAKAIFQLEKRIGTGKDNLDQYGATIKRTANGSTDLIGTLLNISDAYNKQTDPAKRAALVMSAFGRQGQQLIPILAKGRDGIKALFDEAGRTHHILDQGDLDRAKQFQYAMSELGNTFQGLKIELGNALAPAVTDLAQLATGATQAADKAGLLKLAIDATPIVFLGRGVAALGREFGILDDSSNKVVDSQKRLSNAQEAVGSALQKGGTNTRDYAKAQRELNAASQDAAHIHEQFIGAAKATIAGQTEAKNASDSYKGAIDAVANALEAEASGNLKAADSAKAKAAALDLVTQAQEREASAISNSLSTTLGLQGAQQNLNKDLLDNAKNMGDANVQYKIAQDVVAVVSAKTADYAATQQALTGHALTAKQSLEFQLQSLKDLAAQNPTTAASVNPLILKMQWLIDHSDIGIGVTADTGQADGAIQNLSNRLGLLGQKAANSGLGGLLGPLFGPTVTPYFKPKLRATGGPTQAGETYLIGEKGPELLTMGANGYVTPNSALRSGSSGATYHITVNTLTGGAEVGRAVVNAVKAYERGNGTAWRQ